MGNNCDRIIYPYGRIVDHFLKRRTWRVSVPSDQLGEKHQGGEIFAGVFLSEMPRLMSEVGVGLKTFCVFENFFSEQVR